ncbi:MAG: ion transporter [Lachnospiraceae bacterium]|nr:ion transporter [Lachnospiraceae bacterium]
MAEQVSHAKERHVKKRIFDIIQIGTQVDKPSKIFDIFIVIMIITSITVTFLQTFDEMDPFDPILHKIELFTIIVFIIEYVLRVFTSDLLYPDKTKGKAAFSFVFSFYGIVDLLTIISYFSVLDSIGFVAFRMIRAVRILRLFKVNTQIDAFNVVAEVLKERMNQILSSIFMIAMLLMASSLCMYSFEHDIQPDKFNNAFAGIWWSLSTVLTIGYGDIYPITIGGRIMAIIISLLGVCVVAIPTGVISAGFVDYYTRLKRSEGEIRISEDINAILKRLASKEGLRADTYVERLILDQERERKEKNAGKNAKK